MASPGERLRGEHEVLQPRLGLVDAQARHRHQHLDGHNMGRLTGQVAPQPRNLAASPPPPPPDPPSRLPAVGWLRSVGSRPAADRAQPTRDARGPDRPERTSVWFDPDLRCLAQALDRSILGVEPE